MLKRILPPALAMLLCCALLWGLLPHLGTASVLDGLDTEAGDVDEWKNVIAYVPLDDRTDNMEDVIYLAEASGYRIVLPEGDSYRTRLDGQGLNSNGTQYGDREALLTWVREMDEQGCDLFLLSLDQLFSGGLVNSRAMSKGQELCFEDGTVMTEAEAFDAFILTLAEDEENRVYLFDSVLRLASTVGYGGFGEEEYYALREYGMVARPALSGQMLTLENIFANYAYAADGETLAEEALGDTTYRSLLTEEVLADYLGARQRKLTLTDHVIRALQTSGQGRIQLIIGIDDSSNAANIQYNELSYIEQALGGSGCLMTGLDSLARLLVGRIAQDSYGCRVKAAVRYFGGGEALSSSEYDRYNLRETVDFHMDFYGAEEVSPEEAELQILVMTAPAEEEKKARYCEELVSALEDNQSRNIPTVLIEASNNAYGETLEELLFARVDFAKLLAFAGKYDQAVVTGVGFAMGFSRYLYLRYAGEQTESCDEAHVRQIANALALSYAYILHTRYELNLYIQSLGYNYNNILPDRRSGELIQEKLNELFFAACVPIQENLSGGRVLTSLRPAAEKQVSAVRFSDVYFPWGRTFEISFTVGVDSLIPAEDGAAQQP
ncbi:MAG: DUF4127 family protein [Oscillospiraceae bacterium]